MRRTAGRRSYGTRRRRTFAITAALLGMVTTGLVAAQAPEALAATNLIPAATSDLQTAGSTGLWEAWYGDSVAQSTAQGYRDTSNGSLAITSSSSAGGYIGADWSDWPGVTGALASTQYTLSYALYGPAGATFTMDFQWYNGSTALRTDSLSAATNGGWVNPSETVTTPANANTLYVDITSSNAANSTTYYLDAIDAVQGSGGSTGNTVTVTNPGAQLGTVGTAASLQLHASDSASGQTLSYSAAGLPAGLTLNASTGLISGTPTTASSYSVTATAKDSTGASGSAAFTWTISTSGGGGGTCTNPVWTDTAANAVNTDQYTADTPYVVAMDMWNSSGIAANPISQTMNVCSHGSWSAQDKTTSSTNTEVLVYPNVHQDFINWSTNVSPPLSNYSTITSSYAGNSSSPGDWEFAYDIWLNGVASSGSNEVMIWTQNHGQTPGGSLVASNITVSGLSWDLYASSDNSYIAFVPVNGGAYPSGTLDLMAFFKYLMSSGHIPTASTLGQIDYGAEVCNTGGTTATYNVTNFSISAS